MISIELHVMIMPKAFINWWFKQIQKKWLSVLSHAERRKPYLQFYANFVEPEINQIVLFPC